MIVVKVGGSLFDHPRLGPGLRAYLDSLAPADVLLVPGGGDFADAVRKLDRTHGLGEEGSHWLALRAMDVAGMFLESVLVGGQPLRRVRTAHHALTFGGRCPPYTKAASTVLDSLAFALEDESRSGRLPHSWDVTSDSIAARAAVVYRAERLALLKSIDVPPGTPWDVAAERGAVDRHFPTVAAELACPVEVVNFRRVLDSLQLADDPRRRVGE